MKKFIINLFLINIFFIVFKVKCNIPNKKCEIWGGWSECENHFIRRTCKSNFSVYDLKSCMGCGKWNSWSPCISGKTVRHLNKCPHIEEEMLCQADENEDVQVENINMDNETNDLIEIDAESNNRFINNNFEKYDTQNRKENEDVQFNEEDELKVIEKGDNVLSDLLEDNLAKSNNDNLEKNVNANELSDDLNPFSDSIKNEDLTYKEKRENLLSENGKLPKISEVKESTVKDHQYENSDLHYNEKKSNKNEVVNLLQENNEEIMKNNHIKETKKYRNNKNFKTRNENKEKGKIEKKTYSDNVENLETSESANNKEQRDSSYIYNINGEKYEPDSDKRENKTKSGIDVNRVYIASGIGATLILICTVVGYMINKEKDEEDLPSEHKDENYEVTFSEDILKSKGIKAYYEEEFWAHE